MRSDWLGPVLSVMHERQFDWLTHALPLEKLNIFQLLPQATHETQRNGTSRLLTYPRFLKQEPDITVWYMTSVMGYKSKHLSIHALKAARSVSARSLHRLPVVL